MDETQVKHFIMMGRRKGTSMEELIFILHDNGVPDYEISNFLEISIKHVEDVLSDYKSVCLEEISKRAFPVCGELIFSVCGESFYKI